MEDGPVDILRLFHHFVEPASVLLAVKTINIYLRLKTDIYVKCCIYIYII